MSLYPAIGYPVADGGSWRISVSGFAWHPPGDLNRRQRMMIRMLRNVMGATPEQLQTSTFENRINQFMATACAKLPLAVKINGELFPVRKPTKRNGASPMSFQFQKRCCEVTPSVKAMLTPQILLSFQSLADILLPPEKFCFILGKV